jgi:hypothetical protein
MYLFRRDPTGELLGATFQNPLDFRIVGAALGHDDPIVEQVRHSADDLLGQHTTQLPYSTVVSLAFNAASARNLGFKVSVEADEARRLHEQMHTFVTSGNLATGNHLQGSAKTRVERLRSLTAHMLQLSENL